MQDPGKFANYLSRKRIPNLDGLRGLAILLVLAHHAPTAAGDLAAQFQHNGKHGVSLFFVISGYIVMTLMLREYRNTQSIDLKGFLWRRALRLWPLYYVILLGESLLVYVAQVYTPENQALFSDKLGCYVLYCTNWLENSGEGPFFVAWSLAVEEQFYLLLSLLLVFLRPAVLPIVFAGLLAAKLLLVNVAGVEPGALPWRILLSYSEAILLGVLLAFLLDSRRGYDAFIRVAGSPTSAMVWLGTSAIFLLFVPLEHKSDLPALAFYLVCTLLVGSCAVNARLPVIGGAALSRVGLLSYGIYLMHMPILSAIKRVTTDPVLVSLGTFAVVLPLAWMSFAWFEEPIRRLGRKRPQDGRHVTPRRVSATAAAPTDDGLERPRAISEAQPAIFNRPIADDEFAPAGGPVGDPSVARQ